MRILLFLLTVVSPLFAQVSASLEGTVSDQSGAYIPAAQLTLTNAELGSERLTSSDLQGRFEFRFLPVGVYQLSIVKNGFSKEVRNGIHLVVGQEASLNIGLQIGVETQQVSVTEDAPIVSASGADVSGSVQEQQIQNLPLNGRSFDLLVALNPGVVNFTSAKTGGVGVSNSTVGNNFAVSGNRPQQNLFLLNGVEFTGAAENNFQPGGTSQELLGVDAVREFNVLRNSYGAEYGKRPGAQVAIVTQSGSNAVHGSVYEFVRNNDFDARNFLDGASAPGFQRNQFGGSLGAPMVQDKTFVFGNFEGLQQHLHQTGVDLVPDSNARAGFLPCLLITPKANPCPASGLAFVGRSSLINAWPVQSANAPDFGGVSEAFNIPLQTIRDDFGTVRVDQVLSRADNLNAAYTIDDSVDFTPTSTNLYSADAESLREQVASLSETHVFSPSLINQGTFGFSRAGYFFTGEPTPNTPAAALPGFLSGDPIGAIVVGGSAASNPTAQIGLAGSNNGSNLRVVRNLFTYEDRILVTHGRNEMTAGLWLQRVQSNETLALSQYGQATFTSLQTLLTNVASSLLYDPAPTPMAWRTFLSAWYLQDKIRLTPQLVLSLGFRAESSSGWNEQHGHASTYTFSNGVINTQPSVSNFTFTKNHGGFLAQPRIGLAWSPADSNKSVFNAGFGIYNDLQDALGYRTDQNAPFNPVYSLPNANVSALPLVQSAVPPATAKLVPGGVQPNLYTPTLISWTARVQQELTKNTMLTVGYVGSHGYHELIGIDANEPFPVICPAYPCPLKYPGTFPSALAGTTIAAGTYYVPTAVRANSKLNNTWTYFSEGDSSYQALQVDLNRRMANGLTVRGAYTWSKTIDDGDSLNATTSGGEPALASNPFNLSSDRGLANFDVRHVASISAVYDLPFRGNRLISGWGLNTVVTLQGGFPFTPQLSYNPSNNGDTRNPVRPYVNSTFSGPVILGKPNQWFNPSAFLAPPNGSGFYGNLGRDTLTGPGLATWDVSLLKTTRLAERGNLQFRAEFFNVLNHANFGIPNAVVFTPTGVSPTAGLITSTATSSRQIQLGLKLLW